MNGARVGKLGAIVLLVLLVGMISGCAWRTKVIECPEEKKLAASAESTESTDLEALKAKIEALEGRVDANEDATEKAMTTAEKALKCCRKEFVTILAEEVYFAFNKYDLDADSKAKLDRIAAKLKEDPDYIIEIAGHCDAIGGTDYNIVLGQKRADAVRSYLVDTQNVNFSRIAIRSGGKDEPIANNDTEEGRAKNRRATISVLGYSLE